MDTVSMMAVLTEQIYVNDRVNRRGWLQPPFKTPGIRPSLADLLLSLSTRLDPTVRQRRQPTAAAATA